MQSWFYVEEDEAATPGSARDFVFETLPEEWSLSSPTALTRGSTGRWISVPADTPRIFHHPITLDQLGMLVEPEATTYIHKSQSPQWTFNACSVSTETISTPFGTIAIQKIQPTTAPTGHSLVLPLDGSANQGTAPANTTTCTYTLVLKPTGFSRIGLSIKNKAGTTVSASYSLSGSVLSQNGGIARIYRDTDAFWQLELTASIGTGLSVPQLELHFEQADGNRIFAGSDTAYLHIAYCGLEDNPTATSPILNNGSFPLTRSADILTSTPSWMRIGAYAFGVRWAPLYEPDPNEATILMLGNGIDYTRLHASQFGTYNTTVDNSVTQASLTALPPFRLGLQTDVFSADANAFFFAHNGDTFESKPSGTLPDSFSILRIGSNTDGSVAAPMVINRLRYWPEPLTPAQTKEFSSDLGTVGEGVDLLSIQSEIAVHTIAGDVIIPVTRSAVGQQVSVSWTTESATALAGVDFVSGAGTLTFVPGDPVAFLIIPIIDTGASDTRSFKVRLANPVGTAVGTTTCTITIVPYSSTAEPVHDGTFGPSLPTGWKVTRNSSGWKRDSNGVWTSVGVDQARLLGSATLSGGEFSKAYSTSFRSLLLESGSTPQGILIERASRNRLSNSVLLSNGTASQGTLSAITTVSAGTIPIGTRIVSYRENTVSGAHYFTQTLTTGTGDAIPNAAADYYYSAMVKPIGAIDSIMLSTSGLNASFPWAKFVFSTMTVHSTSGSNVFNPRIERCPGFAGVYRVGFGFNSGAGSSQDLELIAQTLNTLYQTGFTGRGSGVGFDVYHNQLEDGQDWTSPIETNGTALQRAADVVEPDGDWHVDSNRTWAMAVRGTYLGLKPDAQSLTHVSSGQGDGIALAVTPSAAPQIHADAVFAGSARTPVAAGNLASGVSTILLVNSRSAVTDLYRAGVLQGSVSGAMTSQDLRLGGQVDGSGMSAMLVERIRFWNTNLSPDNASLFSGNIGATPPVGAASQSIVSLPRTLFLSEGVDSGGGDNPVEVGGDGTVGALTISKAGTGACSVLVSTVPYTAGNTDFTPISNQLVSFAPEDIQVKINIDVPDDLLQEGSETFTIILTSPTNCLLGNAVCMVSII